MNKRWKYLTICCTRWGVLVWMIGVHRKWCRSMDWNRQAPMLAAELCKTLRSTSSWAGLPKWGGTRCVEQYIWAPIQTEKHHLWPRRAHPGEEVMRGEEWNMLWNSGVPIQAEKQRWELNSDYNSRGVPKEEELHIKWNSGAPNGVEKPLSYRSCAERGGGKIGPTNSWLQYGGASRVKYITGNVQNIPQLSFWAYLQVAVFPLEYRNGTQLIAVAVSANVCGTWGWRSENLVDWCPKLLLVGN